MVFHADAIPTLSMLSVSVIIPVYDAALYVERCIRSVMAQDYPGEIECIIIDDGSTDRSMEIIDRTIDSYAGNIRFRILRHGQNRGLSDARNTGIEAATGDYILFLDSDDELSIHALSLMTNSVEQHPGVDIVAGEYYLSSQFSAYHKSHPMEYLEGNAPCRRELLREGTILDTAHNKLLRRNWIDYHSLRFHSGIYYEDSLWKWDCAKCAESISFLRRPTMVYFNNPGSIVNRCTGKHLSDTLKVIGLKLESIDNINPSDQLRNIVTHLASILSNPNYAEALAGDNDYRRYLAEIIALTTRKATLTVSLRATTAMTIIRIARTLSSPSILRIAARIARRFSAL